MKTELHYTLTLVRDKKLASALIFMFDFLHGLVNKGLETKVNKNLDIQFAELEKKFISWHFSKDDALTLSEKESELLFECSHAAHFYMAKQTYNYGVNRDMVNWLFDFVSKKIEREYNQPSIR